MRKTEPMLWGFLSLMLGVVWGFFWLSAPKSAPLDFSIQRVEEETFVPPKAITSLNELNFLVPPLSLEPVLRDMRTYANEFKDKSYLELNRNQWTVQVMDVGNHEIITKYLDGRSDRKKFAYFRYTNANNVVRYILTYELFKTAADAILASKSINFGSAVEVRAEAMTRYLSLVDNYARQEKITELPKPAKLQETEPEADEILEGLEEIPQTEQEAAPTEPQEVKESKETKEPKALPTEDPSDTASEFSKKEQANKKEQVNKKEQAKQGALELPPPPTITIEPSILDRP